MKPARMNRSHAAAFLCLFVVALAPWLIAPWWRHTSLDAVAGILVAGALAAGGGALSQCLPNSPKLIPARIAARPERVRSSRPRAW